MPPLQIKVCGVTTPDDVRMVANEGVDAIGFNFYPKSPRYVEPAAAMKLLECLPPFAAAVGLFVGTPLRQATAIAYQLGLRAIQNYDDRPPGESLFPFAHLPAFRVQDAESLVAVKQFVAAATALGRRPAAVLLDSYVPGTMGGTGHKAPWQLLVGFDPGVPVILAGGLTPENVAEAVRLVRPWGVDVASGVESSPGKKDAAKVRAFVKNAPSGFGIMILLTAAAPPESTMSNAYWIGVDLGGTKILTGLFDDSLQLIARAKNPTAPESGADGVVAQIVQSVDSIVREANIDPTLVRGMGFGIPGQIEPNSTRVRFAPNLGWRDVDIQPMLPEAWKWPVVLENDVRMGTYGEFAHGAGRGAKHVFGIFVGTGVGGGLILNGELFNGFRGHAGEIGHIVIHWRRGTSLESVAGRKYQMIRAKEILDDAPKRVRKEWKSVDLEKVKSSQLAEFYQRGDPVAVQLIDDAARALAAGIASVVNFISPEVVIVGGGVAKSLGDTFIERIWEITQRYTLPDATKGMRCVAASLGDDSGIVGCAAYAKAKLAGK